MLFRISSALLVAVLANTSLAQSRVEPSREPPNSCPATTQVRTSQFIPPYPYSRTPSVGAFWFGTDGLWTNLRSRGIWGEAGHYKPDDPTFGEKLFFWRTGYNPVLERKPRLTVTGKRLDAPSPPLKAADHANGGWQDRNQPFMVVVINLPTRGCWEITARYETAELSFVVWVAQ